MWGYVISSSLGMVALLGLYLIRKDPVIRSLATPYLNRYGVIIGKDLNTLVSSIQVRTNHWFDIVWLDRRSDRIIVKMVFSRRTIVVNLCYPAVGTTLKYYFNGIPQPLPFELGTPFELTDPRETIILYKRVRKGHRFIEEKISSGKSWPLSDAVSSSPTPSNQDKIALD